jgi:hypothetical protein
MHFAHFAALAGLLAPTFQKDKPAPVDPKQVEAAMKEPDAAFKDGKTPSASRRSTRTTRSPT